MSDKMRDAFEKDYVASLSKAVGVECTAAEVRLLRKGNGYGSGNFYLNGRWEGWQAAQSEQAAAPDLLEALEAYQTAQAMPRYGDYSGFEFAKRTMRHEGDPAWGYICDKHGLGYSGRCVCCEDDFSRHRSEKDSEARYARDDALREAERKAAAAIAKAKGEQ